MELEPLGPSGAGHAEGPARRGRLPRAVREPYIGPRVVTDSSFEAFLQRVAARLYPVDLARVPAAEGGVTQAAVTLLLRPADGEAGREREAVRQATGDSAEILFIKRALRAGDPWSGHLAFPGGRAEEQDATLLEVAMRETAEEVAIDARQGGRLLGRLPTLRPLSARNPSIIVTPFVAVAPPGAVPRPQPQEVAEAFWMPLATIRRNGRSATVRWETGEGERELPAFPSPKGPIWGITERILSQFLALVD
jgi:8-oxo-dGTP pyrophosphatase MutT (NUDIX family)